MESEQSNLTFEQFSLFSNFITIQGISQEYICNMNNEQ